MKLILALTAAAFYGGAHLLHGPEPDGAGAGLHPHPGHYRLVADATRSCALSRGAARPDGSFALIVEPRCDSLLTGIARAAVWREEGDGMVTFSSADGKRIVAFSPADGDGYLSYAPAAPLLSLAAQ
jgi:hypothetical protein